MGVYKVREGNQATAKLAFGFTRTYNEEIGKQRGSDADAAIAA